MPDFAPEPAKQVNSSTAGNQVDVSAALLPGGGHVITWTTFNANAQAVAAEAQVYDASGAKAGPELTLAAGDSVGGVAALPDGSFVVSLTHNAVGPDFYPRSEVDYAHFDAAGNAIGTPVVVDNTGTYDVARQAGPVFALPGGGFAVVDIGITRPTPVSSYDNSIRVFDASGAPVAAIDSGENYLPQIQAMTNGGFVFADWPYTGPGPSRLTWETVDAQGHQISGAQLKSTYGQNNYGLPAVVALAHGGAVVVWDLGIYNTNGTWSNHWQAQLIGANGQVVGAPFDWAFSGAGAGKLTALADGGFLVSWATAPTYGAPYELYAQAFDSTAHANGNIEHLATLGTGNGIGDTAYSITATPDGGFLLDYQRVVDGQDIFEQKFDAVPASSGGPVQGGPGTLSLPDAHTQYTISSGSISGPDGTVSLAGIDRVLFADDIAVAFDIKGNAGEAYRLYQATFHRAPDASGLGYHINDLDHGVSLSTVAAHFIESPEFQATYGNTDNTRFITLLYENTLHREPDAAGQQFHLNEFAQGESRADMLTHFSESPENQANVIGQIQNGMWFVPA